MNKEQSLLEFPCDFPIKIMGRAESGFRDVVVTILRQHIEQFSDEALSFRLSRNGVYMSITVVINASSREQLDAIYMDLSACEKVVMAL